MIINITDGWVNDSDYNCTFCSSEGICFNQDGSTNFCPVCGVRLK